jgi:hypothetical protein
MIKFNARLSGGCHGYTLGINYEPTSEYQIGMGFILFSIGVSVGRSDRM